MEKKVQKTVQEEHILTCFIIQKITILFLRFFFNTISDKFQLHCSQMVQDPLNFSFTVCPECDLI